MDFVLDPSGSKLGTFSSFKLAASYFYIRTRQAAEFDRLLPRPVYSLADSTTRQKQNQD
jgi:hypothetical protein